jgi:hypothetical protein
MNQKHCKFCGKTIDVDSIYCAYCGGNVENLSSNEQVQSSIMIEPQKNESISPFEKIEPEATSSDQYFTIGIVSLLITVFWIFINRFIENASEYNEIWKVISIITISAVSILCAIFTKKQSYRIVLGLMSAIIVFYYIFIYYIEK